MNALERLAHLIAVTHGCDDICTPARIEAQALVDAGWHDGPKVTDADRAVLDALGPWLDALDHLDAVCNGRHPAGSDDDVVLSAARRHAEARQAVEDAARARREAQT